LNKLTVRAQVTNLRQLGKHTIFVENDEVDKPLSTSSYLGLHKENDFSAPVQFDFVDENALSAPVPDDFDPNLDLSAPVQSDFVD